MSNLDGTNARTRAMARVRAATPEQVNSWALEYVTALIIEEDRRMTLAEERAAQHVRLKEIDPRGESRYQKPGEDYGDFLRRDQERRDSIDLNELDPFSVNREFRSEMHYILSKVGREDRLSPVPGGWGKLDSRQRGILIHAMPWHPAIDKTCPEWSAYEGSHSYRRGVEAGKSWAKRCAAKKAKREALSNKLMIDAIMSWTKELLASEFALPDGSRVTWGSATVEQHQIRIDMLHRNAEANIEAAARHDAALDELTGTGATCLNDLDPAF